jgi:hypothetical protein
MISALEGLINTLIKEITNLKSKVEAFYCITDKLILTPPSAKIGTHKSPAEAEPRPQSITPAPVTAAPSWAP